MAILRASQVKAYLAGRLTASKLDHSLTQHMNDVLGLEISSFIVELLVSVKASLTSWKRSRGSRQILERAFFNLLV